jgi:hypothetical protein
MCKNDKNTALRFIRCKKKKCINSNYFNSEECPFSRESAILCELLAGSSAKAKLSESSGETTIAVGNDPFRLPLLPSSSSYTGGCTGVVRMIICSRYRILKKYTTKIMLAMKKMPMMPANTPNDTYIAVSPPESSPLVPSLAGARLDKAIRAAALVGLLLLLIKVSGDEAI